MKKRSYLIPLLALLGFRTSSLQSSALQGQKFHTAQEEQSSKEGPQRELSSEGQSESWEVYVIAHPSNMGVNQLIFKKGSRRLVFTPDSSTQLADVREQFLADQNQKYQKYFISSWINGSRNLLIRIFNPERAGTKPLCSNTILNFDDKFVPQIQFYNNQLSVLIRPDDEGKPNLPKPVLVPCADHIRP
jgi:hypothetical protein